MVNRFHKLFENKASNRLNFVRASSRGIAKKKPVYKTKSLNMFVPSLMVHSASTNSSRSDIAKYKTSTKGIDFIKAWEQFRAKAYNDSEGYCTIGYGHLIAKDRCENITIPEAFKNGITEAEANRLFKARLLSFENAVKRDIIVTLSQNEFDALVSLLFNTGANFLNVGGAGRGETKIKRYINAGKYNQGADEMADITNGGVSGLVKRRRAEIKMFKENIYDATH